MRALLAATATLAALVLPSAAGAATFGPCPSDLAGFGLRCTTVRVPLDRTGAVPGTIDVFVARAAATGRSRGTLVLLAGGPGDGSSWMFTARRHLDDFAAARRTHDLLIVDGRGTGHSGALTCVGAAACAQALGPAATHYTTADVAEDLEAVRAELGIERWSLYGISYGTHEAQTYARRHPDRVERLVLDSVVDARNLAQPFLTYSAAALPRALRATSRHLFSDYVRLVDRLERRPGGITPLDVAAVTGESDVNADLRAELPAAVEAALRRDYAPLRRLAAVAALDVPARPEQNSPGRFVAGACSEQAVPWDPATPPEQRLAEADRRAALLPADALFPFDRGLAVAGSRALLCLAWPVTPAPAADPGPLPDVPALLLQGDADLRTPLAGARHVAAGLPHAQLVVVRGAGHNVLRESGSACPARLLGAFMAGAPLPACRAVSRLRIAPRFPTSARALTPRAIARATVADTLRQVAMRRDHQRGLVDRQRFAGLRGGTVLAARGRVRLRGVEYVDGAAVTGTVDERGRGVVRVRAVRVRLA